MKIAAEEKAKYDAGQLKAKEERIRQEEREKLRSGGLIGSLILQAKKVLKDVL